MEAMAVGVLEEVVSDHVHTGRILLTMQVDISYIVITIVIDITNIIDYIIILDNLYLLGFLFIMFILGSLYLQNVELLSLLSLSVSFRSIY